MFRNIERALGGKGRSEVAELRAKVRDLEVSKEYLKKEIIRLATEIEKLQLRQQTSVQFYEFRLDQIYHNIIKRLPERSSSDASASEAIKTLETNPDWERLVFGARESFLEPGLIPSPLTLSGFRIDTRRAIERIDHVELLPGKAGIAVFGPYRKLRPGRYEVHFALAAASDGEIDILIEAYTAFRSEDNILSSVNYSGNGDRALLEFEWPFSLAEAEIELRIHQMGHVQVNLTSIEIRNL